MRHGKASAHDFAALDVDNDAAIFTVVAPALEDIALRNAGDIFRLPIRHGDAVQMTPVFGGEPADEGRLPKCPEAVSLRKSGEAIEAGVDEKRAALTIDRNVMGIDVAGEGGQLRHVENIGAVGRAFFLAAHGVAETINLRAARHPQIRSVYGHAETAAYVAIEHPQFAVGLKAQKKYLSDLVGGEGDARTSRFQPGFESAAREQLKHRPLFRLGRRGRSRRNGFSHGAGHPCSRLDTRRLGQSAEPDRTGLSVSLQIM